ncbi:unnamed protein product [Boreogadus saida]
MQPDTMLENLSHLTSTRMGVLIRISSTSEPGRNANLSMVQVKAQAETPNCQWYIAELSTIQGTIWSGRLRFSGLQCKKSPVP